MYKRSDYKTIMSRMNEPRKFIQVIVGPKQVGKSTVVKQAINDFKGACQFFSADNNEVDFILRKKGVIVAIEVKGNAEKRTHP